jgi:iron complex outermembrane receptor protein
MMHGRCLLLLLAALLVGLTAPAQAQAQEQATTPAAAPEDADASSVVEELEAPPDEVELITVIGERLDATDVQDEAQAITAFSAEDLDRANIVNIDSLQFSVPGLHVGQSGQQAIVTLRGIGTENASITGEPGVAFHVDGVNYSQPSAARVAFFDLETLDVKRGPQGLMGGKNSTSGTINVITKKPHDEYEVSGDVLFGNYDRVRARGAVNLPLGEFAATRFAFFHEDRDGYLDNRLLSDSRDPFDVDDFGLRTHLRLTPSDSLDIVLTYNYFKQTGNGPQADLVPVTRDVPCFGLDPSIPATTTVPIPAVCDPVQLDGLRFAPDGTLLINPADGTPFWPAEYGPATEDSDPREIYSDFPSAQDNRFWGWTGTVDWDVPALPLLGETRVKAIGGFQRSELTFRWDFDGTDRDQTRLNTERGADQHTAELQWSGTIAERLQWIGGGYFARETGIRDLIAPQIAEDGRVSGFVKIDQSTENKAYGAYLHTTLDVTDTIRFELGGRWIKDRKRTDLLREVTGTGTPNPFIGCTGSLPAFRIIGGGQRELLSRNPGCTLTFRGTTWGAALDWRPFGGDHLLYAKIDRGYKSGGFRAGGRGEYLPERIWAYALGTKSGFFDERLQLNLEGFFYSYEDLQLVIIDGFTLRTENSDAKMYGFDVEAKAMPIPGLQLSAVLSHLKTETNDYYSLDPADIFNTEDFPASTDPTRVANYQNARLFARNLAEENAEESRGGAGFEDQRSCLKRPPGVGTTRCGDLGDQNGLDNFSDNDLSRSPEWKVTLSAEYEIPLADYGTLTPRVQYTWQDDTYYRVFNRQFDLQESYHLTDAKLIWRSPEDRWEAEIFVTNIEDETPKQNILVGSSAFGSPALAWWGAPRYYGFRLGFRY